MSVIDPILDPVRADLNTNGIARRMLTVDEMPEGADAAYSMPDIENLWIQSWAVAGPDGPIGDVKEVGWVGYVGGEDVYIYPTFDLTAPVGDVEQLRHREDALLARLLNYAVPQEHRSLVLGREPDQYDLNYTMMMIEEHELVGAHILCNPDFRNVMEKWDPEFFQGFDAKELDHVWTAYIYESDAVPRNVIYMLAPPEFVGMLPIRRDLSVDGTVITETIGMGIQNDYATACLAWGH